MRNLELIYSLCQNLLLADISVAFTTFTDFKCITISSVRL